MKEIAGMSEGTMTGQKRTNVSLERKPPPSRNKREPERIVTIESAISKLQNLSQNRYIDDQYDRFRKHVAEQLRELPLHSSVVLQEKIQSLLTNERLQCANTPTPLASYVSSVIPSPSEQFAPYEESDAFSTANVTCDDFTSDDISKYMQL
jgi:hypothetical protein